MQIGLALINLATSEILARYPASDLVYAQFDGEGLWVEPGWRNETYAIVPRVCNTDIPDGQQVATETDAVDGGQVVVTRAYEPIPQPPKLVAKKDIIDRLHALGKLEAAYSALNAADLYTRERWNARDAIYADDPTALALLRSIGAEPSTVLA